MTFHARFRPHASHHRRAWVRHAGFGFPPAIWLAAAADIAGNRILVMGKRLNGDPSPAPVDRPHLAAALSIRPASAGMDATLS